MIDRVGGGDGEAEGADAGGALQWNGDDFGTRDHASFERELSDARACGRDGL